MEELSLLVSYYTVLKRNGGEGKCWSQCLAERQSVLILCLLTQTANDKARRIHLNVAIRQQAPSLP